MLVQLLRARSSTSARSSPGASGRGAHARSVPGRTACRLPPCQVDHPLGADDHLLRNDLRQWDVLPATGCLSLRSSSRRAARPPPPPCPRLPSRPSPDGARSCSRRSPCAPRRRQSAQAGRVVDGARAGRRRRGPAELSSAGPVASHDRGAVDLVEELVIASRAVRAPSARLRSWRPARSRAPVGARHRRRTLSSAPVDPARCGGGAPRSPEPVEECPGRLARHWHRNNWPRPGPARRRRPGPPRRHRRRDARRADSDRRVGWSRNAAAPAA